MILSGRGAGKTRTGAEWVVHRAEHGPFHPIALVGQTKADVRDTMIEAGASSIMKISNPWFTPRYEPSKRRVTWPNGVIATAFSGDEPDQLRGPQHGSAWVDELAKFKYPDETWSNLEFGLRLGETPRVVITTTPRPIPIIKRLSTEDGTILTRVSTYDNWHNLSPTFIKRVIRRYEGTRLARQELYGEIIGDVEGALWTRDMIEATRVSKAPDLVRIVVGVDPHASSGETGIIVAGLGSGGHGYILDDRTTGGKPAEWGGQVAAAYNTWMADKVVAEANHGGDMVVYTISSVDSVVGKQTKKLYASRGKRTRAEPVSALYEKGEIHHVGMFSDLEDEQCSWVQGESDSPNRMDAMVWAITELMLDTPGVLSTSKVDFYARSSGITEVEKPARSSQEIDKLLSECEQ